MSTVTFWIFVPFGISIVLVLFNRSVRVTRWIAAVAAVGLAVNLIGAVLLTGLTWLLIFWKGL